MENESSKLTHQLKAVRNERSKVWDLKVTNLGTGEEKILPNDGGLDAAVSFENALAEILGGDKAVVGIYSKCERPKVTDRAAKRIYLAYANSFE